MSAARYSGKKSPQSNISVEPFSFVDKNTPDRDELKHSASIRSAKNYIQVDSFSTNDYYPSLEQKYVLENKYRVLEQEKVICCLFSY